MGQALLVEEGSANRVEGVLRHCLLPKVGDPVSLDAEMCRGLPGRDAVAPPHQGLCNLDGRCRMALAGASLCLRIREDGVAVSGLISAEDLQGLREREELRIKSLLIHPQAEATACPACCYGERVVCQTFLPRGPPPRWPPALP